MENKINYNSQIENLQKQLSTLLEKDREREKEIKAKELEIELERDRQRDRYRELEKMEIIRDKSQIHEYKKIILEIFGLLLILNSSIILISNLYTNKFLKIEFIATNIVLIFIGYLFAKKNFFSKLPKKWDDSLITYKQWSGIPGFFRSMGITGMPLITILVTLIFCILAMLSHGINAMFPKTIPESFPSLILELSKLTLGAFIGSFVNKSIEKNKQITET